MFMRVIINTLTLTKKDTEASFFFFNEKLEQRKV